MHPILLFLTHPLVLSLLVSVAFVCWCAAMRQTSMMAVDAFLYPGERKLGKNLRLALWLVTIVAMAALVVTYIKAGPMAVPLALMIVALALIILAGGLFALTRDYEAYRLETAVPDSA